ncbi:hypothetical protein BGZ80_004165 [Entomortierella chlamydospora]|uniref:Uncharacterized protein n=1 Tax=Entomortierella chlamydospora TaxID=101097 RepID=A0A9P6MNN7_9FUNG|nr:hypothetical protein BGZ79_004216 [Entomortierella chlamydospora]KAG0007847.1 hypothetical protein BGZ80_004165 [Entomortierella chlamydospora]
MRFVQLTLALSLAFILVASAAPAPVPIQETEEQARCVDVCLSTEEDCLLNSNSMTDCVTAFDSCHRECVPEVTTPPTQTPETEEEEEEEEDIDDGFVEIPAPKGGEDDEEFDDEPSDY